VGILFTDGAKTDKALPFKRKYSRVHSVFSKKAEEHGMNAFFAHHREFKDGKLKKCWYKENGRWKVAENQEIDLIYSRFAGSIYKDNKRNKSAENFKYKMAEQVAMINHPVLDEFCWDKRIVAEVFPENCPRTFIVNTKKGLDIVLPELKTDKIILKPRYGTLGKDIVVVDRDNLPDKIEKNTLVQEFIDTSKGIKGVTDGMHDMRLIMINGKIDHVHIRIPKKGLLTANVALGGKKVFISRKLIPKKARIIAGKIDKLFKELYPRIYSVDFMFDAKGKPYIVECNSQPMIDKYAFGKFADLSFYDRMLDTIKKSIPIKVVQRY
ncbi:ATP-grasp domain-containing protein, partial [Candidatus Woesearchaeota archaeon]|nr:ATP-grasp domain-containing protein [Candidatus Woesearchaeota archaeon]